MVGISQNESIQLSVGLGDVGDLTGNLGQALNGL